MEARNRNATVMTPEQTPGRHVWLALGGDDDAGVGVVEAVLGQSHESSVLLHEQDE